MAAYYNEHDAYAAQWLRNLIAAGHIAPGDVDERDIRDVRPDELRGYTQCHFFAGIGIWSYALRRAGWSDDEPIWTGSCPCQPFSAAGAGGGFADERHLWPHWFWLISQCAPGVVLGEQVASKDGLGWLDLVSADLEEARYAVGANDLCAAGFGGAHIRQRLYFTGVADAYEQQRNGRRSLGARGWPEHPDSSLVSGVGDAYGATGQWNAGALLGAQAGEHGQGRTEHGAMRDRLADASSPSGLAHSMRSRQPRQGQVRRPGDPAEGSNRQERGVIDAGGLSAAGSLRDTRQVGSLYDADWLLCRNPAGEPSWRPVMPLTFPLAHGAPARVGRLRAYGNGLHAETATAWCETVMGALDDVSVL